MVFLKRSGKPDPKGHTLHASVYMKYPEHADPPRQKALWQSAGLRRAGWVHEPGSTEHLPDSNGDLQLTSLLLFLLFYVGMMA